MIAFTLFSLVTRFGYSRDDIGKFLQIYLDKDILADDPFQVYTFPDIGGVFPSKPVGSFSCFVQFHCCAVTRTLPLSR